MLVGKRIPNPIDGAFFRRDEEPGLGLPDRELVRDIGNGQLSGRRPPAWRKDVDVRSDNGSAGIASFYDENVAVRVDDDTLWLVQRHAENRALCGTWRELRNAARTGAG